MFSKYRPGVLYLALDFRCNIVLAEPNLSRIGASKSQRSDSIHQEGFDVDINVRAFRVVQAALNGPSEPNPKREASKRGGQVGGRARARAIDATRRKEIATKASRARWAKRRAIEGEEV